MRRSAVSAMLALALVGCTAGSGSAAGPGLAVRSEAVRTPDVRYEPSPRRVVRAMLKLAEVNEKDFVYDLGCGDGRIPISAAKGFGARAVGIEIDPKLIARAKEKAARAGVSDRVEFRHQDLFETDLKEATVVTLFLSREVNRRLRPKLLAELRPGARVVSHWHDMGDWQPDRTIQIAGRPLYLWTIKQR